MCGFLFHFLDLAGEDYLADLFVNLFRFRLLELIIDDLVWCNGADLGEGAIVVFAQVIVPDLCWNTFLPIEAGEVINSALIHFL